jgi:hypothetical protein
VAIVRKQELTAGDEAVAAAGFCDGWTTGCEGTAAFTTGGAEAEGASAGFGVFKAALNCTAVVTTLFRTVASISVLSAAEFRFGLSIRSFEFIASTALETSVWQMVIAAVARTSAVSDEVMSLAS